MYTFSTRERAAERKPLPKEPIIDSDGLGSGGALSLDAQNEAATQVFNTEALESCEHCGRTFLKDRCMPSFVHFSPAMTNNSGGHAQ